MIRHLAIGLLALASGVGAAQAQSGASVARGKYLVDTVMTCQNCHTPRGPNGLDLAKDGSGFLRFDEPPFDVTAANITSSKTKGLGGWTDAEIKQAITTGVSRDGSKLKGPMGFEFYAKMKPEDLDDLVAYIRTVPAID